MKEDRPEKKTYVKKVLKTKKAAFENEFLLLIFLLENHKNLINDLSQEFFKFIESTKREEISSFKVVINQINKEDSERIKLVQDDVCFFEMILVFTFSTNEYQNSSS